MMQNFFARMQSYFPSWRPADGNLETVVAESFSSEAADIGTLTGQVGTDIFRYYGSSLLLIDPIEAQAAHAPSTWTLIDSAGYTIFAGTQVGIRNSAGDLIPFVVAHDVIVPGGSSA